MDLQPDLAERPSSREALLDVALDAFGRHGFNGTTTRAIADAAGMPMSQITYHFGGKQGLYLDCARLVVARVGAILAPAMALVEAELAADPSSTGARAGLLQMMGALVGALVDPRTVALSRFVLREQAEPTEAFAILYSGPITRVLGAVATMLARIEGRAVSLETRLRAVALFGQVIAFRVGHAGVLAFTGWKAIGEDEVGLIRRTVLAHVEAVCDALLAARGAQGDPGQGVVGQGDEA